MEFEILIAYFFVFQKLIYTEIIETCFVVYLPVSVYIKPQILS